MKKDATKQNISEGFKELLAKKPINRITINEIADQCGVSRMTFYYHFKDIYNLAEWTLLQTLAPAIGEDRTYDSWQQGFLNTLNILKENQRLLLNVYHSMDREMIEQYMHRAVENLIFPVVVEAAEGLNISEKSKRRVSVFYTHAFLGTMLEWIRQGMVTPTEEVVSVTAAILHGDFRNSLENMSRLEAREREAAKKTKTETPPASDP